MKHPEEYRIETDGMGDVTVPIEALYGASTARAVSVFSYKGMEMPSTFIAALARIKRACAQANVELGLLDKSLGQQIEKAAEEVLVNDLTAHFPVSVFQTGSGTSTNMNMNEVIANRCSQVARKPIGSKEPVHPNDHVNLGQSSNDVIPSALHISVAFDLKNQLIPSLESLSQAFLEKQRTFEKVIKLGRTHLMDAIPLTLGQEFSAYAQQIRKNKERATRAISALEELAIGGTAVGNGRNTHREFGSVVCRLLSKDTGLRLREAENHFEAQSSRDDAVEVAGQISAIAASLGKIANDIRLLGSGPRSGLAELQLPAIQPGSSIMPGKVNPVIPEILVQVCHHVISLCQTVTRCGQDGHLQLNTTMPLMAFSLLQSIALLSQSIQSFTENCISGIQADEERCRTYAEQTLGLATALNPYIGYDKATEVAKRAWAENKSIREIVLDEKLLDEDTLDACFKGWLS